MQYRVVPFEPGTMTSRNSVDEIPRRFFLGQYGNSRPTSSQDRLQLRSPRHTLAADRPFAACAPQPHASDELLAACGAGGSFHQLAAGPAWKFPRPARVSKPDPAFLG